MERDYFNEVPFGPYFTLGHAPRHYTGIYALYRSHDGSIFKYEWVVNGLLHREDGPAMVYSDGEFHWCLNGHYHRVDGPAIISLSPITGGAGRHIWYLNNSTFDSFDEWLAVNNLISDDEKLSLKLQYG